MLPMAAPEKHATAAQGSAAAAAAAAVAQTVLQHVILLPTHRTAALPCQWLTVLYCRGPSMASPPLALASAARARCRSGTAAAAAVVGAAVVAAAAVAAAAVRAVAIASRRFHVLECSYRVRATCSGKHQQAMSV
eukprot:11258-Heterococcus_DN1.PRE.2